ncbi:MAG TPA: acyltransferase [Candidatus Paceibacterota bacterium]|nr:acyltransferase [Verrucomicrobiota bacterium]HRY50900.1 acyltransferase [Candidatus Paceibacterota bacterium]HSA03658.1 acyltransferase [Candidatus Paceibacterota bacterium]
MEIPSELSPAKLLSLDVLQSQLQACGQGVKVYTGCRLYPPDRICVGDYSQIDEGVRIYAGQGVTIGRYVHLAFDCSISGGGQCVIRDFAGLGAGVRLITGSENIDGSGLTNPTVPESLRRVERGQVIIGAHAVIFTNSIVLPGVTVGDGAVVSAGSVVHRDLKPWCVYAGNPLVQVGIRPRDNILRLAVPLNHEP